MKRISIKSNYCMGYGRIQPLLLAVGVVVGFSGRAQLEGKTLQSMLDQIAALNAYSAAAADGYNLVENGWHTVATIRQGEFDLHKTYYGSLLTVNPAVRGMAEAGDIVREIGLLVNAGHTKEAKAAMNDLTALLTHGQLSMTDGERMRRVITLDAELRREERLK
jgi:hypothetical protein